MKVSLIVVPYHLGQENTSVGKGPDRMLDGGLSERLARFEVGVQRIDLTRQPGTDLEAVTEINRQVKRAVDDAVDLGRIPVILGGNCITSLGAIAALDTQKLGVVWFDAHGDFNTPDTSPSGFVDGFALAIATGRCERDAWRAMGATTTLPDANILLAGIRDLDDGERKTIEEAQVAVAYAKHFDNDSQGFVTLLDRIRDRVSRVYVHVDIDVVDPDDAPGVEYRTPQGITGERLILAIEEIGERFEICGANLADVSPDFDTDGKTINLAVTAIESMVRSA